MKSFAGLLWIASLLCSSFAIAQQSETPSSSEELKKVLSRMDTLSEQFHTAQANFVWNQYQRVVDETDTQKGKIYFRRVGKEIQMAAEITESNGKPQTKYVLFNDSKVSVYQPALNLIDEYPTGKNKEAFESFLVLGFGGSGKAMLKAFDVTYSGMQKQRDEETTKLNLVPKSPNVRSSFPHIMLWINQRGISVQQQLFSGDGDYRIAKYSDIEVNEKLPDSGFKLKTNSKTQVHSH